MVKKKRVVKDSKKKKGFKQIFKNSIKKFQKKRISQRKKRSRQKVSPKLKKPIRNIPNPFNRFSSITTKLKGLPVEKLVIVVLIILVGLMALDSKGYNLTNITGKGIRSITGNQVGSAAGIADAINNIFSIITEGIAKPVFEQFGTHNVVFLKLIILVFLYLALAKGLNLEDKLHGTGKIIAGLTAFIASALVPPEVLNVYVLQLIPGIVSLALSVIIFIVILYWMHKVEAESGIGHFVKSLVYFIIALMLIKSSENFITIRGNITSMTNSTIFGDIGPLVLNFILIYCIVMFFIELFKIRHYIGRRRRRPRPRGRGGEGEGEAGIRRPGRFRQVVGDIAEESAKEFAKGWVSKKVEEIGSERSQRVKLYELAKKYGKKYFKLLNPDLLEKGIRKIERKDYQKSAERLIKSFIAEAKSKCPDISDDEIQKAVDIVKNGP